MEWNEKSLDNRVKPQFPEDCKGICFWFHRLRRQKGREIRASKERVAFPPCGGYCFGLTRVRLESVDSGMDKIFLHSLRRKEMRQAMTARTTTTEN